MKFINDLQGHNNYWRRCKNKCFFSRSPDTKCLNIHEGGDATLWCNATDGYPKPDVKWFIRLEEEDRGLSGLFFHHKIQNTCKAYRSLFPIYQNAPWKTN